MDHIGAYGQHHPDHPDHGTYGASRVAEVLGLGKRRVLQMLERGELEGTKDELGRWVIPAPPVHALLQQRRRDHERRNRTKDPGENDTPPASPEIERELIDSLKDQVEDLRQRLDREQDANRENRRIIAALTQRIPELEAPRDERGSPETPSEPTQGTQAPQPRPTPQTGSQRRTASWWRRIVGM